MAIQTDNLRHSIENVADLAAVVTDDARMAQLTEIEQTGLRAGVIKNFEITYELSWKLMQRWIREAGVANDQLPPTRHDLFRLAAEIGLIADAERWMEHHRLRNSSSHEYGEAIANFVAAAVQRFIDDARHLVARLERPTH